MDLNFHQTFKPEKNYISEILQTASEAKNITLSDLSYLTGIPQGESSGKLIPHLKYAKYMGLIDFSCESGTYNINLTNLGSAVLDQDVSLTEDITMILLNSNIINKENGAELWSYCFNDFFNKYGNHSKYQYYLKEISNQYGEKVKYGPFVKSYEEFFSQLNLIEINADNPQEENSICFNRIVPERELLPAIGYILFDLWDKKLSNEGEITSSQLSTFNFRNCFAWSESDELIALEKLEEYGLIRINKQLTPYTIIKLKEKEDILKLLYSELF